MQNTSHEARAATGSGTVRLPEGSTYYELAGPAKGVPVVLIHGFSVPAFIWDPVFAGLAAAGFRVLRYDLYGRGASDRPRGRYDRERFDSQLVALVEALGLGPNVDLVGLSMGGAIAVEATDRHPNLVRKLVLMDPAGLERPSGTNVLRAPLLGELVFAVAGKPLLIRSMKHDFFRPGPMAEAMARYQDQYLAQLKTPGFLRALLSTIRHGPLEAIENAYQRVGHQERQVLLIWGREDRTVPFALSDRVRALMPNAIFHPVEGAGHVPHLERPDLVNALLVDFLATHP
mgnify:CR=1 FL=1